MKTTVNGKGVVMGKNIKGKKKRRNVKEVKSSKSSSVYKEQAEACAKDCTSTCDNRQDLEARLRDIASSNIALHVQNNEQRKALESANNVIDRATEVVSDAATRLNDARATLEIFCGANLGVDIRDHYKKAESNDFHGVLNIHTSQQQVCAKAVARLASMLYTILTREL